MGCQKESGKSSLQHLAVMDRPASADPRDMDVRNLEHSCSVQLPPLADGKNAAAKRPGSVGNQRLDWQFDQQYHDLIELYRKNRAPVAVNFRKLVALNSGVDRFTHLIHSYPAKLLVNIPVFFLNCPSISPSRGMVFDPFCGTGTTLIEAILAGRSAAGADANPLARQIAAVKLTPLAQSEIESARARVRRSAYRIAPRPFQSVVNVDRWFSVGAQRALGCLSASISRIENQGIRQFMEVCLSSCVRRSSFADPRLSVPVRSDNAPSVSFKEVLDLFDRTVIANAERIRRLDEINPQRLQKVRILSDAREAATDVLPAADLIITSPPYLGAQKYIRASSLSIGWLGLAPNGKLRDLERLNIGREHFSADEYKDLVDIVAPSARQILQRVRITNPLRAHIAATYLAEMRSALSAACGKLQNGGHFILIIGDNSLCGEAFPTSLYLKEMLEEIGLSVILELIDDIRSRGLMTKRNKTAGMISHEHIIVFRK